LVGAEFTGPGHECPDVLRQTAASETQSGVEESAADAVVVADCVGEHRHVGPACLTHLADGIDERDLGCQKCVRRDLHQFGGRQVGVQERNFFREQVCVEFAHQLLGVAVSVGAVCAEDDAVGVQGVLDREAFA